MRLNRHQISNKFGLYTILLGLWLFPGVLLGLTYQTYFLHWLFIFLLGITFWKANYEEIMENE